MTRWQNWSGLVSATPTEVRHPTGTDDIVAAVRAARDRRTTVKMAGAGHSFTSIAAPEHTLLSPRRLSGIVAVDRDAMTVTVLAGTRLHELNDALTGLGLGLHNMGDIDVQTIAGAISTGTHGTGGVVASLSAQVAGLELVTGTGEVLRTTETENPDVLDVARLGLGALGILTAVTLRVEPAFVLEAHEQPMGWDEAIGSFDAMTDESHHCDMYWFPHTDRLLVKRNVRLDADLADAEPLPRWRAWLDDDFLANTVFGGLTALGSRAPAIVPRMNQLSARVLSERTYSDAAPRVFTSPRRVVFREMEYAVPRAVGLTALAEVRRAIEASDWRISFPVEIRVTPSDDIPLSTSSGRDSLYLAFHTHHGTDHTAYFTGIEAILRAHDGRPHWGKLHTRRAADLAPAYPRFEEFLAMRDRLDPERVFDNPYLRQVLGD